jgi:hypothetical protein
LPYPDAKVAEKLCLGRACYYLFPEELTSINHAAANEDGDGSPSTVAMMKTFILSNVVPNIRKVLPDSAALVLGKAFLWLIYSPYNAMNHVVPVEFRNRIRLEWNEIMAWTEERVDVTAPDYNPSQKVPVVVTGDQGCVYIDLVPSLDEVGGEGDVIVGAGRGCCGLMASTAGGFSVQLLAVQSLASQIRHELHELRTHQMADRFSKQKGFTIVNANIRRIALQPGVRGVMGTSGDRRGHDDITTGGTVQVPTVTGHSVATASLSPNPKNLFELLQEYQVGIGGQKAAKPFTQSEQGGRVKHKYHRRKVVWSVIEGLV